MQEQNSCLTMGYSLPIAYQPVLCAHVARPTAGFQQGALCCLLVQVPFHEWAEALEAADPAVATTDYLQRKLAASTLPQPAPVGM